MWVRTRQGLGQTTIAWLVGVIGLETTFSSSFFFNYCVNVVLLCKVKVSISNVNSYHFWYYIHNVQINACSVWTTELCTGSLNLPCMSVRWAYSPPVHSERGKDSCQGAQPPRGTAPEGQSSGFLHHGSCHFQPILLPTASFLSKQNPTTFHEPIRQTYYRIIREYQKEINF